MTQRLAGRAGALAGLVEYTAVDANVTTIQATICSVDAHGGVSRSRVVVNWNHRPDRWHEWCHMHLRPWHERRAVLPSADAEAAAHDRARRPGRLFPP